MSVENKGFRLHRDGKVRVVKDSPEEFWGLVDGDSGEHIVVKMPSRGWWCECPSRVPCSHIYACQLVRGEA